MWLVCSRLMGTSSQARSLDLLVGQISASSSQQAKCYSAGTLTTVSDITSISGNITASVGHVSAYGNLQSSSGHITAQNGNISRQRITASGNISAGSITSTGAITGGTITSTSCLAVTGTTGRHTIPPVTGCYLGCDTTLWAALELCGVNVGHVDFHNCWNRYEASVYIHIPTW